MHEMLKLLDFVYNNYRLLISFLGYSIFYAMKFDAVFYIWIIVEIKLGGGKLVANTCELSELSSHKFTCSI